MPLYRETILSLMSKTLRIPETVLAKNPPVLDLGIDGLDLIDVIDAVSRQCYVTVSPQMDDMLEEDSTVEEFVAALIVNAEPGHTYPTIIQ